MCVSENISVQLSVLEWEMINLSKGMHSGGNRTQSWLSYRLSQYENQ